MSSLLLTARVVLGLGALAVLAEISLASAFPAPTDGECYFLDWNYERVDGEAAMARGMAVAVEGQPRPRMTFIPGTKVRLRYEPAAGQDWLDADGSVPVVFNGCGLRDREEVCAPKGPGERRAIFLGDSVTFGWGVRVEDSCCRLTGEILRQTDPRLHTINCASGTLHPDEYAAALATRFGRFEPDVVVVNLSTNDLLMLNSGVAHRGGKRAWWQGSAVLRAIRGGGTPPEFRAAPGEDWTDGLLALPDSAYSAIPKSAHWCGGGPQQALQAMQTWCAANNVRLAVVLWPALQGIAPGESYPFAKLHAEVGAFCEQHSLLFADLLPAFVGHDPSALWVTPFDQHGNPRAQRLAAPVVADLVRRALPPR